MENKQLVCFKQNVLMVSVFPLTHKRQTHCLADVKLSQQLSVAQYTTEPGQSDCLHIEGINKWLLPIRKTQKQVGVKLIKASKKQGQKMGEIGAGLI